MNSYKLNDKKQDQEFLSGRSVKGVAVFRTDEFNADTIQVDQRIVVLLSNSKKYLGKIAGFTYHEKGEFIEGELQITKA